MKKLAVLTASIALVALAGCGSDEEPTADASSSAPTATATTATPEATATPEESGTTVDVTIADGKVDPQGGRVEAKVGEEITLSVTSDAADELHVHSDPEHSFQVTAGDTDKTFTFTVETPGQVAVELHDLGVTVVQLVVTP